MQILYQIIKRKENKGKQTQVWMLEKRSKVECFRSACQFSSIFLNVHVKSCETKTNMHIL